MSNKIYFQYQRELNLPIYLTIDSTLVDASLQEFFSSMKFTKLAEKEQIDAIGLIKKNNQAKVLNIEEASPLVSKQINLHSESDRYGAESIVAKDGYRVYRYKNLALMVYSFMAKDWKLGVDRSFGGKETKIESRMALNRFLSLSLSTFGIVGFFGVTVEGGMVVQKPSDSKSEVVFIDVLKMKMISVDGVKNMKSNFKILRLDPMLRGRNVKMTNEELISFLSQHVSFLDTFGLSVPIRQMIQSVARMSDGLLHPEESFRPRTDLSL